MYMSAYQRRVKRVLEQDSAGPVARPSHHAALSLLQWSHRAESMVTHYQDKRGF